MKGEEEPIPKYVDPGINNLPTIYSPISSPEDAQIGVDVEEITKSILAITSPDQKVTSTESTMCSVTIGDENLRINPPMFSYIN